MFWYIPKVRNKTLVSKRIFLAFLSAFCLWKLTDKWRIQHRADLAVEWIFYISSECLTNLCCLWANSIQLCPLSFSIKADAKIWTLEHVGIGIHIIVLEWSPPARNLHKCLTFYYFSSPLFFSLSSKAELRRWYFPCKCALLFHFTAGLECCWNCNLFLFSSSSETWGSPENSSIFFALGKKKRKS